MHLLDILFPPREDERRIRDISPLAFLEKLSPYQVSETRPGALALLPFGDPLVRAAIHEAKYRGSAHAFSLLAEALADFLPNHLADSLDVGHPMSHIMVPVPLGEARRKERGYNQVEEVAHRALMLMNEPSITLDTSLLIRTRETPTQISLARPAREANMKGAFTASPRLRSASRAAPHTLYIVLDDVLTTGATLGAAIEALAAAGLPREQLLPIALAYQS